MRGHGLSDVRHLVPDLLHPIPDLLQSVRDLLQFALKPCQFSLRFGNCLFPLERFLVILAKCFRGFVKHLPLFIQLAFLRVDCFRQKLRLLLVPLHGASVFVKLSRKRFHFRSKRFGLLDDIIQFVAIFLLALYADFGPYVYCHLLTSMQSPHRKTKSRACTLLPQPRYR